ncbi:MAG: hypothetical protein ACTSX8_02765 [Alphaproteobacteria bacterium]
MSEIGAGAVSHTVTLQYYLNSGTVNDRDEYTIPNGAIIGDYLRIRDGPLVGLPVEVLFTDNVMTLVKFDPTKVVDRDMTCAVIDWSELLETPFEHLLDRELD